MSPKELLYIEDALGHSQQMQTSFSSLASQIQDAELKSFNETLCMQNEIYSKMSQKGWYPAQKAQQQIDATKQKFTNPQQS